MRKIQRFPFFFLSTYSESCVNDRVTEKPESYLDEHLENLISMHSLLLDEKTPFCLEVDKTISRKKKTLSLRE